MNNIFVFRFSNGMNIIGQRIDDVGEGEWKNNVLVKKARVIIPMPGQQQGMVDIRFGLVGQTPVALSIEETDNIKEFNKEAIWVIERPNQNILSAYMKDTSGVMLPIVGDLPKEMRQ